MACFLYFLFVLKNSNSKRVSFQIKSNQSEHEGVRKDTWDVYSSVDSFFLQKHVLTLFSKVLYVIVIFCWDDPYELCHNSSTYIGFSATDSPESIGNLQNDNLSKCICYFSSNVKMNKISNQGAATHQVHDM